jgi:tRNA-binding protein
MDATPPLPFSAFQNLDVRVGTIRSAQPAEGCRAPSYRLVLDFGDGLGTRRSVAQVTHYRPEALVGKQVLAVVNLGPRQVGRHVSEVLVLGVPTGAADTAAAALVVPDLPSFPGARLF